MPRSNKLINYRLLFTKAEAEGQIKPFKPTSKATAPSASLSVTINTIKKIKGAMFVVAMITILFAISGVVNNDIKMVLSGFALLVFLSFLLIITETLHTKRRRWEWDGLKKSQKK